ncbi:MAG: flagellar biosynthesis anti-sigma factor FlgM [bacterium]|jgi:hypothetical protein|nr:flagellar biosynthesis anti-sigma factor FlgM [bacterium]
MDISTGQTSQLGQALRRAAIEARYQSVRDLGRAAESALAGEDRVEISRDGRDLGRLRGVLMDAAAALPDVREEILAQVRDRMATGYYDREVVVDRISDRLLEQGSLRAASAGAVGTPEEDYRQDLMREVNDKIQSGFYTDGEVMKFVADRLMNIYQIDSHGDKE